MRRDFELAPNMIEWLGIDDDNDYDFSNSGDPTWVEIPFDILGNNITEVELKIYFNNTDDSATREKIYINTYEVVSGQNVLIEFGRDVYSALDLGGFDLHIRYEVVAINNNTPVQEYILLYGNIAIVSPRKSDKEIEEGV